MFDDFNSPNNYIPDAVHFSSPSIHSYQVDFVPHCLLFTFKSPYLSLFLFSFSTSRSYYIGILFYFIYWHLTDTRKIFHFPNSSFFLCKRSSFHTIPLISNEQRCDYWIWNNCTVMKYKDPRMMNGKKTPFFPSPSILSSQLVIIYLYLFIFIY